MSRVDLQPAFILHQRKYRDTSLIVDALTPNYGHVSLVARGARGTKKQTSTKLQPFQQVLLSWLGKGELFTLIGVEEAERPVEQKHLRGEPLYCAYYLSELTMKLMPREDPHPEVFIAYHDAVDQLRQESPEIEVALRRYEIFLLESLGYQLVLDCESDSGASLKPDINYRYFPEQGPVIDSGQATGILVSGKTLVDLSVSQLSSPQTRSESRRLLKQLIDYHLDGRELKSREIYRSMFASK